MSEHSVAFKFVKSVYIVVLVVGFIGSGVLFVIGTYALTHQSANNVFYENVMKYYGINEKNFEPVLNETTSVQVMDSSNDQSKLPSSYFSNCQATLCNLFIFMFIL